MKEQALFILESSAFEKIYGSTYLERIAKKVTVNAQPHTAESILHNRELLDHTTMIFSGWGAPRMDAAFLKSAPNLKIVFYGAGSVRGFVTDELWERGVRVVSAWAANAVPVTEYALAAILFSLKRGWHFARQTREQRTFPERTPVPGAYGSTVGIVSLGMIGRMLCEKLRMFDVRVIAYDPYVNNDTASKLGVEMVDSLDTLFRESDVVTLHTPALEQTRKMIKGEHFACMKSGATFINTARGAVVDETGMLEIIRQRTDIQVVLDVTWPEPPGPASALYSFPNVVLTPHIAGSLSSECRRLGAYMFEELERYLDGKQLLWELTRSMAEQMA